VLSETEIISTHFNSGSMSDSQLSTNSRYDNNESQVLSDSRESVEPTCSFSDAETQWSTDSQGAPLPRLIMAQNLGESSDSDSLICLKQGQTEKANRTMPNYAPTFIFYAVANLE